MPIVNRLLINPNNEDEHYEVLATRQTRNCKNYDTTRSYDPFSIGSTVVVQQGDDGLCTYGTVVGRGDHNHNNRSCMIRISKTGWIVIRNSKHVKATPITAEQYLSDQINKNTTDPFNEILKNYEKLVQENISNKLESLRREDTFMNNKNDKQHSKMQQQIENMIPASCEQKEISSHTNKGKLDERINTQTHYGRISRKLNWLTYH